MRLHSRAHPVDYAPFCKLREGARLLRLQNRTLRIFLKMQTSTASPVTNTTVTTNTTKSREQILIQSSGAMIAVIVVGIIIILTVLLIILKTYNRRTHASRVLGASSKPRPKMSQSTVQSSLPLTPVAISSVSHSISISEPPLQNGFQLPRVELSSVEENHLEQFSATSSSSIITIHELPSVENR